MKNCSCVAYAYDAGIGCMLWSRDLIDVQKFSNRGVNLYIRLPSSELDKGNSEIIVITTVISGMVMILIISALFLLRRMGQQRERYRRHTKDYETNKPIEQNLQHLEAESANLLKTVEDPEVSRRWSDFHG